MSEYDLSAVQALIERIRPISDAASELRYLRLQALFVYFQYGVASVRMQEENIRKMANQHRGFDSHDEYQDCLFRIYSSAVTAYSNFRTCLNFSKALINYTQPDLQSPAFREFRIQERGWVEQLVERRDKVTAHPEKLHHMVWKPNMWSDDGRVRFVARHISDPAQSHEVFLEPRRDLELLRTYLTTLAGHLAIAWRLT